MCPPLPAFIARTARRAPPGAARGLTLIELCVVLALVALALGIALPGLGGLIERKRLHGMAAQLAADLHWVREEALARNEPLRFSIQATASGSCTVVHTGQRDDCRCEDPSAPAVCVGGATALKTSHWPGHQGIAVQANVASMLFDPDHGTTTPAGSVRLVDRRGAGITHVVNVAGRVRTCSPEGAVPGYRAC